MYPIEIYLMIILVDGALTIYSVIDKGSEYYKEIIALAFACFLSVYIALVSVSGTILYGNTTPIQDDGLMWIFFIVAAIQGILCLLEIVVAYDEHVHSQMERKNLIRDTP